VIVAMVVIIAIAVSAATVLNSRKKDIYSLYKI
jgi:hypothetical protein